MGLHIIRWLVLYIPIAIIMIIITKGGNSWGQASVPQACWQCITSDGTGQYVAAGQQGYTNIYISTNGNFPFTYYFITIIIITLIAGISWTNANAPSSPTSD